MKNRSLTFLLLALLHLGVSQCSSAYRLVDYKEYCAKDDLDAHTTYQYENGVLYSKTDVLTTVRDLVDSTVTYYDAIKGDNCIDSIETSYRYLNGVPEDIMKVVRTFNSDGIIQKDSLFVFEDNQWRERTHTLYDSKGRWVEFVGPDMYRSCCTYDSLGRQIGRRYIHAIPNAPIMVDTVVFASDGKSATFTQYLYYQNDDRWDVFSKKLYILDNKGRVISQENVPLDNDTTFYPHKTVYRYDRKGRIKTEKRFRSDDEKTLYRSYKHKYRFGLRNRSIEYDYTDGQKYLCSFTVFKYDFRHRLLLEKTQYDDRLRRDFDERKVWTYEKVQ